MRISGAESDTRRAARWSLRREVDTAHAEGRPAHIPGVFNRLEMAVILYAGGPALQARLKDLRLLALEDGSRLSAVNHPLSRTSADAPSVSHPAMSSREALRNARYAMTSAGHRPPVIAGVLEQGTVEPVGVAGSEAHEHSRFRDVFYSSKNLV